MSVYNHSDKVAKKIQGSNNGYVKQGAAGGMGGLAVAAGQAGARAPGIVAANGVAGGHAMKAMVQVAGANNAAIALRAAGGANAATIILPVCYLGVQFGKDVYKFWRGEIDGRRLAENSVSNLAGVLAGGAAGFGGAIVGAEIGLLAGPVGAGVGAIAGAVAGGIAGGWAGNKAAQAAFSSFFGSSCDQRALLRKSYRTLGLTQDASNETIRKTYLKLSKQSHPDKKGGDQKKFIEINSAYEVIRASRGQR
jgi:hypothetical protein